VDSIKQKRKSGAQIWASGRLTWRVCWSEGCWTLPLPEILTWVEPQHWWLPWHCGHKGHTLSLSLSNQAFIYLVWKTDLLSHFNNSDIVSSTFHGDRALCLGLGCHPPPVGPLLLLLIGVKELFGLFVECVWFVYTATWLSPGA
jgi:hypothetical protein